MDGKRLRALGLGALVALALGGCVNIGDEETAVPAPTGVVQTAPAGTAAATPTLTVTLELPAPVFSREKFPEMDGSTSTKPMMEALVSVLLEEGEEPPYIYTSKTTESYRRMIGGWSDADILLAAEPNDETLAEKEEAGFQWEMAPFADEGFVFVVNEGNPVDSLTVDQLRGIYAGTITNWREVGGADLPIVPFQRNQGAGSQTLMEELVMGDTPMAEAPEGYLWGDMGDLMKAVRSFDGTAAAIGYSVYYYANDMEMAGGLKLLRVDGVAPSDETIRSGAYPLRTHYYAVIRADEPEDSPARVLYDWLLSEGGQRLVGETGYVPVLDGTQRVPPPVDDDAGLVDMVETRWYPGYTPELLPLAEGYGGALVPYVGGYAEQESSASYFLSGKSVGLMTDGGTVVTDPEFYAVEYFGPPGGPPTLMVLTGGPEDYAVADLRGRWYAGMKYRMARTSDRGLFLAGDGGCDLMDWAGTVVHSWSWAELGLEEMPEWWAPYGDHGEGGPRFSWERGLVDLGDGRVLDTETGTVTVLPSGDEGEIKTLDAGDGQVWYVEVADWDQALTAFGPDGTPLELPVGLSWKLDGYYSRWSGWLRAETEDGTVFYRNGTVCSVPGVADYDGVVAGMVMVSQEDGAAVYRLEDGECVIPAGRYSQILIERDPVTLKPYYLCYQSGDKGGAQLCLDAGLNVRYTYRPQDPERRDYRQVSVCGGLLSAVTENSVRVWDEAGALVFSRPLYPDWGD